MEYIVVDQDNVKLVIDASDINAYLQPTINNTAKIQPSQTIQSVLVAQDHSAKLEKGDKIVSIQEAENLKAIIEQFGTSKASRAEASTYLILQRIVTEQVYRTEVVASTGTTTAKLAHNNTTPDDAFAIGVAMHDAAPGQLLDILVLGVIQDPAFAVYPLNATIFLDSDGGTTDTKPTQPLASSTTIIGRSYGNGEVFVNVERPVFI